MRTIVDFPPELIQELDKITKMKKISRAEALRRAAEKWIEENKQKDIKKAFGLWKKNPMTDKELAALRKEWGK